MLGEAGMLLPAVRRAPPWERWLLLLLVLLAFGLYLWRIEAKSIWWDEGLSLYRAQQDPAYILSNRIQFPGADTTDQHPPLYFLVLHAFTQLAGESDLVLRLPSALSATLLVPLLYALGMRLRGRRVAMLAALFGALSPFYLWYAQEARPYTMVTALGLASVLLLWSALTERRWSLALGYGLVTAAALATQYLFGLVVLFQAVFVLAFSLWGSRAGATRPRPRLLTITAAAGLPLLAVALLAGGLLKVAPSLAHNRTYVPLQTILLDALNSFSLGLSVHLREVWPLDALFVLVLVLGFASLGRRVQGDPSLFGLSAMPGLRLLLVAGYLLVPALAMWVISFRLPIYMNSRYTIISSPGYYLGLAVGVDALLRTKKLWGWAILLVLLLGMGFSSHRYYFHERYSTKQDYRSAAYLVADNERVRDVVVVTGHENLAPFLHYYSGTAPVAALPSHGPDRDRVAADLETLTAAYDRVWLVQCPAPVTDPDDLVTQWLDASRLRMTRTSFASYGASVSVNTYLADAVTVDDPGGSALGHFGDGLELVDCVIRYPDSANEAHELPWRPGNVVVMGDTPAGKLVSVAMTARVRAPLGTYKTSMRLVDMAGRIWAQRDADPIMSWPTTRWAVDETVRFEVDLPVPPGTPPGAYGLQMWLYEADTLQPVSFRSADGAEEAAIDFGVLNVARGAPDVARELLPADIQPVRWRIAFGGRMQLLGWRLAPETVRAGEHVTLDLMWRALATRRGDYELQLHWEGSDGRIHGAGSYSLTGVPYASSTWLRGETVRGKLMVPVPAELPPGHYWLHLLIHEPAAASYLWVGRGPVPWTGRNLRLADILVDYP
ncbi:MAG: glycosyltransferase family 39 protein [Anaerolineae bacterium]